MLEIMEDFISVIFLHMIVSDYSEKHQDGTKMAPSWNHDGTKIIPNQEQLRILNRSLNENFHIDLRRSDRSKFRKNLLIPLIQDYLIEMTLPNKPKIKNQKYKTTAKERILLEEYQVK